MQCVEKNMKLFPLAVCQKLKNSSNCHSLNFPTLKTVNVPKKEMLVAKCQIAIVSMCLIYSTNCSLAVCKSYALPEQFTNQQRNHAKTGKESKDEQEDRRKNYQKTTSTSLLIVPTPNTHVVSLLWSCLAAERNATLGKTAVRNLEIQDLMLPHQHAELLCGEGVQVAWQQDLQV